MNRIFTIGFTGKTAEKFFSLIEENNIKKLIDVRLNNVSQLAAFSKKDDLEFFLKRILSCDYIHRPDLAPTETILKNYKSKIINWDTYTDEYIKLLDSRNIASTMRSNEIINSVFLCSEHQPKYCHRRLLVEYFQKQWNNLKIIHLI
ncbi:MAG: DUF488 domain-containing protein [Treponema sp.]|jgi:uncharacterized protein (DUF488 family)|nr:DUF488 domain-containing protein [Treponema sp.]